MTMAGSALVLGLMLTGVTWVSGFPYPAALGLICDSPEVEEAATVALDYINNLHKHGYKYALNRVEDAKVIPVVTGGQVFLLELDLLQTTCHVLDPTPLANCTVRAKIATTVEGDCDAAISKVGGVLAVKAFKCQSKPESIEDICVGCPVLLPLNHTAALQIVDLALATVNKQSNITAFALQEVSRLTSQMVGGGAKIDAEFVLAETNCIGGATEGCGPLQGLDAHLAVCQASAFGQPLALAVNCKLFHAPAAPVAPVAPAANDTVGVVVPPPLPPAPVVPPLPHLPGLMHHKLTHLHLSDPSSVGLVSESKESAEVPVLQMVKVKRSAPILAPEINLFLAPGAGSDLLLAPGPGPGLLQMCPGKYRYFRT